MAYYIKEEKQLAQYLTTAVNQAHSETIQTSVANNVDLKALVDSLIDSLPYYLDPGMMNAHRGALANLLEYYLPNDAITPQPSEAGFGYFTGYSYNGSYSGYQAAFYGVGLSNVASLVQSRVQHENAGLNSAWWGNYGVAILTDAIRQKVSVGLDTNKLTSALQSNHATFLPALSASYLAVFILGFSPTVNALQAIKNTGQTAQAAQVLNSAILSGEFTANINESLAMGGQSAIAATWFLYNLWMALAGLSYPNIDVAIQNYKAAGLNVPVEVDAYNWWNGKYVNWYNALGGGDVMSQASSTITASMPEIESTTYSGSGWPVTVNNDINLSNGYSTSFCEWGALNWYKPESGSCFGKGTLVLMADGTNKAIEKIQIGESVMTNIGARKVVLIESPERADRNLYRINDLELSVTSAHPFRTAYEDGPQYAAVNPWGLADGIPTMSERGIEQLQPNVSLLAFQKGEVSKVSVKKIEEVAASEGKEELVYDLLLENWERDRPAYYVGGPDIFLATEAETVDPTYNYSISAAIISALQIAIPVSRQFIKQVNPEIPRLLGQVDMDRVERLARKQRRSIIGNQRLDRVAIPKPEFYMANGEWDAHASLLEYYLVRRYSRRIRSTLNSSWRVSYTNPNGNHLTVGLFYLELINAGIPADTQLELELSTHGTKTCLGDEAVCVPLSKTNKNTWFLPIDQTANLGRILAEVPSTTIMVTLKTKSDIFGKLQVFLSEDDPFLPKADHFIYNLDGAIIGRLGLDVRRLSDTDLNLEQSGKAEHHMMLELYNAVALGKQLGYEISTLIQANATASIASS